MRTFTITSIDRTYANNGQHMEQALRFALTGEYMSADNRQGADLADIQIKSARATICPGLDVAAYVENDVARRYIYITKEYVAYEMSKTEYIEFATTFATITKDSEKNGGGQKTRLKHETKRLLAWLECHAR